MIPDSDRSRQWTHAAPGVVIALGLIAFLVWTSADRHGEQRAEEIQELCNVTVSNGVAYITGPTLNFFRDEPSLIPMFITNQKIIVHATITTDKNGRQSGLRVHDYTVP